MSLNLSDIFKKEYLSGYYSRNSNLFLIAFIIFVSFMLLGSLIFTVDDIIGETELDYSLNNMNQNFTEDNTYEKIFFEESDANSENFGYDEEYYDDEVIDKLFEDYSLAGFLNLFIYNFSIDFNCIIGGLILSIPSIIITFINAAQIGIIFSDVNFLLILLGILPHGIFEIPSSYFALVGAFMLTYFETKILKGIFSSKTSISEAFNTYNYLIKDSLISVGIVFILLWIAAFIETFITPILLLLII